MIKVLFFLLLFSGLVTAQTGFELGFGFLTDIFNTVFALVGSLFNEQPASAPPDVPFVTCSDHSDCLNPGTSCCDNVCTPVLADPNNCGTCDNYCSSGQVCVTGECTQCGNSVCEPELGEHCGNCADCTCLEGQNCREITPGSNVYSCGGTSVCGDGFCDVSAGENCNCEDCACTGGQVCVNGSCTSCGNGYCDSSESCATCSQDCGSCPFCGDGSCNGNETCTTSSGNYCPTDCGSCVEVAPTVKLIVGSGGPTTTQWQNCTGDYLTGYANDVCSCNGFSGPHEPACGVIRGVGGTSLYDQGSCPLTSPYSPQPNAYAIVHLIKCAV